MLPFLFYVDLKAQCVTFSGMSWHKIEKKIPVSTFLLSIISWKWTINLLEYVFFLSKKQKNHIVPTQIYRNPDCGSARSLMTFPWYYNYYKEDARSSEPSENRNEHQTGLWLMGFACESTEFAEWCCKVRSGHSRLVQLQGIRFR